MISLNEELLELDLSLCELENNSLKYFKKSFKKLKKLSSLNLFGNNLSLSLDFIEVLLSLPKLVNLNLNSNSYIDEFEMDLGDLLPEQTLQIEKFSLNGCLLCYGPNINNIFELIRISPKLVSIDISDNGFIIEWIESLVQVLGQCPNLSDLNLSNNDIDDEGSKIITKLLKSHKIVSFNISKNDIGDEGVISIANALSQNPNLTFFDLSANKFGNEGIIKITNALSLCPNLTNLNLSNNNICDMGASCITNVLFANSSLHHINLSNNKIGDVGASNIAIALCIQCPNLKNLNLEYNMIGNEGATKIVNAQSFCSKLNFLYLSRNMIDDEVAKNLKKINSGNRYKKLDISL